MDTSKFSLEEAEKILRPYIKEVLSFHELVHCQKRSAENVGGVSYTLRFWEGPCRVPLGMTSKDRVHGFPISRKIEKTKDGVCTKISYKTLLLLRSGGHGAIGHWYLQSSVFESCIKALPTVLDLTSEHIEPVDDEVFAELRILEDYPLFPDQFWGAVIDWLREGISRAKEKIKELHQLESVAGIKKLQSPAH